MGKGRFVSIDDVLQSEAKQHYKNILLLLYVTKREKMRLIHLRYIFIKNSDNIEEFRNGGKTSLSKAIERGVGLERTNIATSEIEGANHLTYYLNELQKLGLIYKYWVKDDIHGYPYYMISDYGEDELRRVIIHSIINELFGDKLECLLDVIYENRNKLL